MNVFAAATVKHLERIVIVIGLMGCAGMPRQSVLAAAALDPNLRLTIAIQTQNIVLGWFGSNAVSYQVEADATLATWTNASLVVTGAGAFLWVTNSLPTRSLGFYRVRRLPPADLISASFDPGTGILTILGDAQDNTITVSRNAAGALLVNNGAVAITGGGPTVANTVLLQIFGREGNDQLSLNEANGALPAAHLFGEAGDDTLAGGASADVLSGGSGSDTLHGWGGADQLSGGDDDDTLTGGDGDDTAQLGLGNDRYIWNPGDDTDVIEGSEGTDTVEVNGGNGAESFTVTANGTRVRFDRLDPAPFALDLGTCENLVLNANGGNDRFSATGNLAALIQITVDGGEGNDTLLGSNGGDVLIGGAGNDFVDGQQGNDVALLGAEDDTFQWDPGDGNDTVEGQTGSDTLVFNGSGANEIIGLSANGTRLRLVRNVGNIVLDLAGVEAVQHRALGGTDTITVNELSGTAVNTVTLDLSGTLGSGVGDSAVDNLILHGSAADDNVAIVQTAGQLEVSGLRPSVLILAADAADTLALNTLGGDDIVDITGVGELTRFTVDAGPGNDVLRGSSRGDVLIGGDDQDTIIGRQGDDLVFGGAGDDVFVWNPGDGNDVLEGQAGNNTLTFNGSNAGETVDIAANGARLNFFRNVGNVVLDGDAVQHIQFNALGGADTVTVGDLSGTDATNVTVDLSASAGAGAGDAQPDRVMVNGSASNDTVTVRGSPGNINVLGLPAWVTVFGGEGTNDTLVVNALGGDDVVDASGLDAGGIQSSFTGGLGDDVMIGSPGDDVFAGGDGDDLILAGAGNDTFLWNPGDDNDTVEGQAGSDTLQFNGSNVGEVIDISANGARVRFFRNVASVVMDCNEVEQIQYKALGGADVVTVNDLAGTDVAEVRVDWAGAGGGGDVQADRVIVSGTSGDDVVLVVGSSGSASVLGLSAQVTVSGSEAANDRLTLNVLGGDDVVDASALSDAVLGLTADGGADDDVLIGSDGPDVLLGGAGNDTLLGGLGVDVLDGGPGDNIVIQ